MHLAIEALHHPVEKIRIAETGLPAYNQQRFSNGQSPTRDDCSHLVSNSTVFVDDGIVLVPTPHGEVEEQRGAELASAGQALDPQDPFQLLAVKRLGRTQRPHRDGTHRLVVRHAVLLNVEAEPVPFRGESAGRHPRLHAVVSHYRFSTGVHRR